VLGGRSARPLHAEIGSMRRSDWVQAHIPQAGSAGPAPSTRAHVSSDSSARAVSPAIDLRACTHTHTTHTTRGGEGDGGPGGGRPTNSRARAACTALMPRAPDFVQGRHIQLRHIQLWHIQLRRSDRGGHRRDGRPRRVDCAAPTASEALMPRAPDLCRDATFSCGTFSYGTFSCGGRTAGATVGMAVLGE